MKKKLIICMLLSVALLACSCGKKTDDTNGSKTEESSSNAGDEDTAGSDVSGDADDQSTVPDSSDSVATDTEDVVIGGLSADACKDAYMAFLNNEEPVYFDKEWISTSTTWLYSAMNEVSAKYESCTLQELIATYIAALEEDYQGCDIYIDNIDYSFIDCGNDGIPELALRFDDLYFGDTMYVDDVLVIKMMGDGKLQMCFFSEMGYRTINELNQYGFYTYSVASGFSDYNSYEYIDENGETQFIYSVNTYYSVSGVNYENSEEIEKTACDLGVENMVAEEYAFEPFTEDATDEERQASMMWTYYENESYIYGAPQEQDESILQDGSDYKKVWDKTGLSLNSYAEIVDKIEEKEKSLGVTEDIKNAGGIQWTNLTKDQIATVYPQKKADSDDTSSSASQAEDKEPVELIIDVPSWDYYNYTGEASSNMTFSLEKVSEETNDIIDEYEWFGKIGIEPYSLTNFSDSNYNYELRTTGDFDPYLLDVIDRTNGHTLVTINMCKHYYPEEYVAEDLYFIGEGIRWAQSSEDGSIIYVCTSHRTYAESAPQNAYITAIQLNETFDDYTVLWRTNALVANANNFEIYDNFIFCGYGFTAEYDYIYVLDIYTGVILDTIPVKSGPDYFYVDGKNLYVRTYNTDYVFEIKK